eukprot:48169-Chlamydomonas_euryale.AAC.8
MLSVRMSGGADRPSVHSQATPTKPALQSTLSPLQRPSRLDANSRPQITNLTENAHPSTLPQKLPGSLASFVSGVDVSTAALRRR